MNHSAKRTRNLRDIRTAGHFDLEVGPHDIGRAAAVLRLGVDVSLGVQMVVGPPKIFKPFLVWAVWPIPPRKARCCGKKN